MQAIGFQEAVEKILAEDKRYQAEAYSFLRDALETTLKRRKKATRKDPSAHVSGAELLEGFRIHALQECGPMTVTVLEYWGVKTCEDIGQMVFNLVNAGVFGKTDEDTLESFRRGYDFQDAFVKPFRPDPTNLSESDPNIVGT